MKKRYKWLTVVLKYPDYMTDGSTPISVQFVRVRVDDCETDEQAFARGADKARAQCVKALESGEVGDPPGSDLLVLLVFDGRQKALADDSWGL